METLIEEWQSKTDLNLLSEGHSSRGYGNKDLSCYRRMYIQIQFKWTFFYAPIFVAYAVFWTIIVHYKEILTHKHLQWRYSGRAFLIHRYIYRQLLIRRCKPTNSFLFCNVIFELSIHTSARKNINVQGISKGSLLVNNIRGRQERLAEIHSLGIVLTKIYLMLRNYSLCGESYPLVSTFGNIGNSTAFQNSRVG